MKEINISVNQQNEHYLYYLQKQMVNKKFKTYTAITTINDMAVLSIACSDEDFGQVQYKLKKYVPDLILYIYKENYLLQTINFKNINDVFKLSLLKALVLFDSESDKEFIKNNITFEGDLYLDSLFNFKLKDLKKRWQEIANLANENSNYFFESETLLELLKFLIATIKPKASYVNVYYNGKNFEYKDFKNRKIKNNYIMQSEDDNEIGLIITLIALAPNTINLHCIDTISNNTFKVLYYIFDKKVNLLV